MIMAESGYGKYIITELKTPEFGKEWNETYAKFAKRILWMDENVVDGAFQMNCSWYLKPADHAPVGHTHDADEIIGFFGSDPDDPYDLDAEIEFWIEDEQFILTRTCMIFIPGGMKHCPLIIRKVNRPVFHFSTVTAGTYKLDVEQA
jgi:hypothetical protein